MLLVNPIRSTERLYSEYKNKVQKYTTKKKRCTGSDKNIFSSETLKTELKYSWEYNSIR